MEKNYNSIGAYDKCNNLVSYIEFKAEDKELKCYYSVDGNTLNKSYVQEYKNESPQIVNSIIQHNDDIMLYPITVQGETSMQVIQSGASFTSFGAVGISSRIDVYDDNETNGTDLQCFSVKSDLIDEWLNKV